MGVSDKLYLSVCIAGAGKMLNHAFGLQACLSTGVQESASVQNEREGPKFTRWQFAGQMRIFLGVLLNSYMHRTQAQL